MDGLKIRREGVELKKLSLEKNDDSIPVSLRYDSSRYSLRRPDVLTPQAASCLLQLHPIYVIKQRSGFQVVAGKRIFQIIAFCLKSSQIIEVSILDRHTTQEQLLLLRYLDNVVSPLVYRIDASSADIFRDVNVPNLRQLAWSPSLASTMKSFAEALGVSPAALVTSSERGAAVSKRL